MNSLLPLLPPHLPLLLGSTAFWFSIQRLSLYVSPKIFPKAFARFDRRTKISWSMKTTSTLHSFIILPLALMVVNHPNLKDDQVFGYDKTVGNVLAFTCGFIWDTIDSYLNSTIGFVIHGLSCLAVFLFSFRPFMAYFGPPFLLWELSTPLLNLHWFLEKLQLDKKYATLFLCNDVAFVLAFFVARIVLGTFNSGLFFKAMWEERGRIPVHLVLIYGIGNIALNALNWLWFSKVVKKLVRQLSGKKTPVVGANGKGMNGKVLNGQSVGKKAE